MLPPSGNIVPNDKKNGIFSEIRNLVVKFSPTIKKEESRCIILWGCPKIRKSRRWRQTQRQKKQNIKESSKRFFCSSLLEFYFYWIIIWKEEKYLYLEDIPEHNEAFKRKVVVMHTKTFSGQVDELLAEALSRKDTNILFYISFKAVTTVSRQNNRAQRSKK